MLNGEIALPRLAITEQMRMVVFDVDFENRNAEHEASGGVPAFVIGATFLFCGPGDNITSPQVAIIDGFARAARIQVPKRDADLIRAVSRDAA